MAFRVAKAGIGKAHLSAMSTIMLALLGGAFIDSSTCSALVITGADGIWTWTTALGAGVLARADSGNRGWRRIVHRQCSDRYGLGVPPGFDRRVAAELGTYIVGNFAGASGTAVLVYLSGTLGLDTVVGETSAAIAKAKIALPVDRAFFRGVLCNALVSLAVWLCFSARRSRRQNTLDHLADFRNRCAGFEHSVANMYLIPIGMFVEVRFRGLVGNLYG